MTRPMIKASEVGAAPQIALPISNMAMLPRSKGFTSYSAYARHRARMTATDAMGNPRPTQGSFSISPKSSYTSAWTSAAIVVSNPIHDCQRDCTLAKQDEAHTIEKSPQVHSNTYENPLPSGYIVARTNTNRGVAGRHHAFFNLR